jgi:hypothetical protein
MSNDQPGRCPTCGHKLEPDSPDPPPKDPDCPCKGDCIACTGTFLLEGDIDDITEQLRKYRGDKPIH